LNISQEDINFGFDYSNREQGHKILRITLNQLEIKMIKTVEQINDKGILLLRKQCYHSARLTFQHALEVALGGSVASCGLERELVANDPFTRIDPLTFHVTDLQAIISAKTPCAIYDLLIDNSNDDTFTLIRFPQQETSTDDSGFHIYQAVLLYNCAMARVSYARILQIHDRPIAATVQHQCAARLLERADDLLDKLSASSISLDKPARADHDLRSISFLHLFVLLTLFDLKASQMPAAKALHEKLANINSNLETLCGLSGQPANHSSSVRRAKAA